MRDTVRRLVPLGSSITDAQEHMRESGFHCVYQWHGAWAGEQDLSYLLCRREEGGFRQTRVWEIAVLLSGITVGEVRVREGGRA